MRLNFFFISAVPCLLSLQGFLPLRSGRIVVPKFFVGMSAAILEANALHCAAGIASRGRHCIARQALHLHCHQHHVTGCGNIIELCERQSIMMPTDAYCSNFFAVKKLCLLVSISSSPLSPFAHETLMLDNQCCHCSSSSSTR